MSNTRTLFVLWITIKVGYSEKTLIPQHLQDCYRWPPPPLLPMNIQSMTEIVRKISSNYYGPLTLMQEISDVLHWFSVEGLERSPNVVNNEKDVVPYHRVGLQAHKQDLLFEKLIPIQRREFQANSLSISEKCTLHFMLSPSVDYWERGDESRTCPNSRQQFRNMSADGSGGAGMYSVCPSERGVLQTAGGPVCISRVLTGLMTALTPQQVPLSQLLTQDQLNSLRLLPADSISNVWAATLAGDLAEVAVEQSPLYEMGVKVGLAGRWNDTAIPTRLYFDNVNFDTIQKHQWQITDAEILGGIDGLLLGNMVQQLRNSNTPRLSQVLEMYYTNWSLSQDNACKRKTAFYDFMRGKEKTLIDQTKRFAALLSVKTTTYFTDSSIMAYRCINAAEKFLRYYPHLLKDGSCASEGVISPMYNLFVILDSTWPPYSSLQFLMLMTQTLDVSHYGSSITVIHGDSSTAVINSTSNPITLYQLMRFGKQNEPKDLILHKSLNALKNGLEVENMKEKLSFSPRNAKQDVVVVMGYSSTISDKDLKESIDSLRSIKLQNPGVQFVYVTSLVNRDHFRRLVDFERQVPPDTVISTDDVQAREIIGLLQPELRSERLLKPGYCKSEFHQWPEVWYNEYITPGQTNTYWIHPDYFYKSLDIVKISFKTYQYGELMVCMSRGVQRGDCKTVGVGEEVTHAVLRPCDTADDGHCLPLYFTVTVLRTYSECTELECRFPSQVKFSIIVQDLHCIHLSTGVCSKASFSMTRFDTLLIFIILTLIQFQLN